MSRGRPRKERYARLMGGFWRNTKVRRLSLEARGLLATAWSYSADQASDGRIPVELLEAWAGKRYAKLMAELAGFLVVPEGEIDAVAHDWTEVNISAAAWDAKLEKDRERKRNSGEFPRGNSVDFPSGNPADFQHAAQTRTKTKTSSSYEEEGTSGAPAPAPPEPAPGDRVKVLSARYPGQLADEARAACALSRRNGRMADAVWATTLDRLAALPEAAVVHAMRAFVEKHADGEKDERYLLGIARGEAKRTNGAARTSAFTRPAAPDAFANGDDRADPESFMEAASG